MCVGRFGKILNITRSDVQTGSIEDEFYVHVYRGVYAGSLDYQNRAAFLIAKISFDALDA